MKLYESGIDFNRTILPQRSFSTTNGTNANDSIIFDKNQNIDKIFIGSSPVDENSYPLAYAFSTEAKRVEKSDACEISNSFPEQDYKVQNNSRNKNLKLNKSKLNVGSKHSNFMTHHIFADNAKTWIYK